jgi:hypothetical protein
MTHLEQTTRGLLADQVAWMSIGGNSQKSRRVDPSNNGSNTTMINKSGPIKQVTCFECKQLGHVAKSCPNKTDDGQYSLLCYFCHKSGHTAPKCEELAKVKCNQCDQPGHMAKFCAAIRSKQSTRKMGAVSPLGDVLDFRPRCRI